jgi:hypothetical protein
MNGCCNSAYTYANTGRSFITRAEKIELLKEYKEQLDLESRGVSEKIKQLEQAEVEAQ